MKKIILLVLLIIGILFVGGCVYSMIKIYTLPNLPTTNTSATSTVGIYVDEEPKNPQNLKEINIADILVGKDGTLALNILQKDSPRIKQLQDAFTQISARPALQLMAENERIINGQPVIAMEAWEVKKGEPNYVYAVMEALRTEFGFKAEIKRIK